VQKLWSVLFGVVLLGALALFVVCPVLRLWWLPQDISANGYQVDFLFNLILWLTGFFYVLTCGLLVYFLWKFSSDPTRKARYTHGNHKLEWFWTVVTGVLLIMIAVVQIPAWANFKYEAQMPVAKQIFEVSARQFEWRIRYPSREQLEIMGRDWEDLGKVPESVKSWEKSPHADDVHIVNEVHTWRKAKVRLFLKSRDVIHSFFLPNLRLKQDALPGKVIPVWFEAIESNIEWDDTQKAWKPLDSIWVPDDKGGGKWSKDWTHWELACAELCGWGHTKMQGRLFVHRDYPDYLKWLHQAEVNEMSRQPTELDKPKQQQ
jgi:cytochrome c oxidase subunit 2